MDDTPTTAPPTGFPPTPSHGDPNPDELRKLCRDQDLAREALKGKLGIVEVAVDLIREARDE